jgi:hypothetical protein
VVTKLRVTDDTGGTPPRNLIRPIGVSGIKDDDRPLGTTNLRDKGHGTGPHADDAEAAAYV